jgi:hypothetical protein
MTLNGELLYNISEKIHIKNRENSLYFISTNEQIGYNICMPYIISIKEITYSSKCKIDLTILPCYTSCKKCSKAFSKSDSSNHNCLIGECKPNYYQSPLNPYNCFMISEKPSSWFFDYSNLSFGLCSPECETCSGPNNTNCLSCYNTYTNQNFSHLYKGQCLRECPEGTFQSEANGHLICEDCYKNCKSCDQRGDYINMNCETCLDNNAIKKGSNCYNVYDIKNKSFYDPENNSVITSCFQLFNYYIKENTNECISSFENGFYISNNNTGLVSKCHSKCRTCSKNHTEISTNCDTCLYGNYLLQEGNCVPNCSFGYYQEGNQCKKCYKNCLLCNSKEIMINNQLTDISLIKISTNENFGNLYDVSIKFFNLAIKELQNVTNLKMNDINFDKLTNILRYIPCWSAFTRI